MSTEDTTTDEADEQHVAIPDYDDKSVEELEGHLNEHVADYTGEELLEVIVYERDHEDRKTAIEALQDAHNEVTSGPNVGPTPAAVETDMATTTMTAMDVSADAADEDGLVASARGHGAGATEGGQPGVVLPSPYADDAPTAVEVSLPREMTFAGHIYDEPGEHTVPYTMRVKTALETETNPVALAASDPFHPGYDDAEEEGPAGEVV